MIRHAAYFQTLGVVSWENEKSYVALVLLMSISKCCVGGIPRIYIPFGSYWQSISAFRLMKQITSQATVIFVWGQNTVVFLMPCQTKPSLQHSTSDSSDSFQFPAIK